MKTMLFNPYTGKPRDPRDIASDPAGTLMLDPDEPLYAATPLLPLQGASSEPTDDQLRKIADAAETWGMNRAVNGPNEKGIAASRARFVAVLGGL